MRALDALHHHAGGRGGQGPPVPGHRGLVRPRRGGRWDDPRLGDGVDGRSGALRIVPSDRSRALRPRRGPGGGGQRLGCRGGEGADPPSPGQRALARPLPPLGLRRRFRLADRNGRRHLHHHRRRLCDGGAGRADRTTPGGLGGRHRVRPSARSGRAPHSAADLALGPPGVPPAVHRPGAGGGPGGDRARGDRRRRPARISPHPGRGGARHRRWRARGPVPAGPVGRNSPTEARFSPVRRGPFRRGKSGESRPEPRRRRAGRGPGRARGSGRAEARSHPPHPAATAARGRGG
jgi:hypothetical protein